MVSIGAQVLFFGLLNIFTMYYKILRGAGSFDAYAILYWMVTHLTHAQRMQLFMLAFSGVTFTFMGMGLLLLP